MLDYREVPDTNIMEFLLSGTITAQEVESVVPRVLSDARKHPTLRILKQIGKIDPIDPAVFGKQFSDLFAMLSGVTHAAIVADSDWAASVAQLATLYPFEVAFFETADIAKARDWLASAK